MTLAFPSRCLLWLLCLSLGSCASNAGKTPANEFHVALPISSYNPKAVPYLATSGSEGMVNYMIYSTLFHQSPESDLKPALIESWTVSDDGTLWDMKLKKNIIFHDGAPLTASDVQYSFDYVRAHAESSFNELTRSINRIEVLGREEIRFHLTRQDAFFKLACMVIPVSKAKAFESGETAFPIGSGPFAFKNYDVDQAVLKLVANPRSIEGRPILDAVTFYLLKNETEGLALFEKGLVDFIYILDPTYENVFKNNPNYRVIYQQSPLYYLLILNLHSPLLGRREVRESLQDFINQKEMLSQMNTPDSELGALTSFDYQNPPQTIADTDKRETAAARLKKLSGTLQGMTIASIQEHEFSTAIVNQVARELQKVGMTPQPVLKPFSELLASGFPYGRYDAAIYPMTVKYIDYSLYSFWHSKTDSQWPAAAGGRSLDQALDRLRYSKTGPEHAEAFKDFEKMVQNDPPFIFLFERYVPMVIHKRFQGYSEKPWDFTLEIKNMWVSPDEQQYDVP